MKTKASSRERPSPGSEYVFWRVLLIAAVFLVQLAVFAFMQTVVLVDADEGFYIQAGLQVREGNVLYRDFLHTQMPLTSHLLALWFSVFPEGWDSARFLMSLAAAGAGTLLFLHVARHFRSLSSGVVAVLLFLSCDEVLFWFPVVKTYALSTLFTVASVYCVYRAGRPRIWPILAGVCLGLAISTRLTFVVALPARVLAALRPSSQPSRFAGVGWLTVGLAVSLLPSVGYLILCPDAFIFDNLLIHSQRSDTTFFDSMSVRWDIVVTMVTDPQFGVGLGAGMVLAVASWRKAATYHHALTAVLLLLLVNLAPTPPFLQYHSVLAPFLVIFVVALFHSPVVRTWRTRAPRLAKVLVVLLVSLSLFHTGTKVNRARQVPILIDGRVVGSSVWKLENIKRLAEAINLVVAPGEHVLAFWSGALAGTHAVPLPTTEMHDFHSFTIPDEVMEKYKGVSIANIQKTIRRNEVRTIVTGFWHLMRVDPASVKQCIETSGYINVFAHGGGIIWQLPR